MRPNGYLIGLTVVLNLATVPAARANCPGDLNCDGVVNLADVGPFVTALVAPNAYDASFPMCDANYADVNDDGHRNGRDVAELTAILLGGGAACLSNEFVLIDRIGSNSSATDYNLALPATNDCLPDAGCANPFAGFASNPGIQITTGASGLTLSQLSLVISPALAQFDTPSSLQFGVKLFEFADYFNAVGDMEAACQLPSTCQEIIFKNGVASIAPFGMKAPVFPFDPDLTTYLVEIDLLSFDANDVVRQNTTTLSLATFQSYVLVPYIGSPGGSVGAFELLLSDLAPARTDFHSIHGTPASLVSDLYSPPGFGVRVFAIDN